MERDIVEVVMNPVRQRIAQYLILHGVGTAGEMRRELSDVPPASLYRHIRILLDAGCIEIAEQRQVRGTVEKVYKLVEQPLGQIEGQDVSALFRGGLLSLIGTFERYFAAPDSDPERDMLALNSSVLMLSDEEFMEFLQKQSEVISGYVQNTAGEGRKPRQIVFVSAPVGNPGQNVQNKVFEEDG